MTVETTNLTRAFEPCEIMQPPKAILVPLPIPCQSRTCDAP
jgi:hypothetical protein